MMCFVYVLECKDGSLYTGWTINIDKRLKAHNNGTASKYTRARLPVILRYYEEHPDKSSAMKREYQIKRMSRNQKQVLIQKKSR